MSKADDLLTARKGLDEICTVPDKIISVYSLEKHVWADSNSERPRARPPAGAADHRGVPDRSGPAVPHRHPAQHGGPLRPRAQGQPIGQGYWIQAEFGSGKSHLLCFLAALALGDKKAWEIVQEKETEGRPGQARIPLPFLGGGPGGEERQGQARASSSSSRPWWARAAARSG